tara:strand:+ start:11325 stop:11507 length:183 start_codon:yes stop_codon:yes gene_type:complete
MRIKEISVEVKKSHNYQTYSCGELIELEEGDSPTLVRKEAMARCREIVLEQIEVEKNENK